MSRPHSEPQTIDRGNEGDDGHSSVFLFAAYIIIAQWLVTLVW